MKPDRDAAGPGWRDTDAPALSSNGTPGSTAAVIEVVFKLAGAGCGAADAAAPRPQLSVVARQPDPQPLAGGEQKPRGGGHATVLAAAGTDPGLDAGVDQEVLKPVVHPYSSGRAKPLTCNDLL